MLAPAAAVPVLALVLAAGIAAPGAAQNLPPENALPLSQVIATVEAREPVRVFTEVEWDDDGYWDVEFVNTDNRRTSVRIDPFSAGPWSRRR